MRDILDIVRDRHTSRVPFDPKQRIPEQDLQQILEAARWAPTAHNMQNFEVIVIDDKADLAVIGAIRSEPSSTFLRENYQQLAFSEEELLRKKTGLLASMFPPSWQTPDAKPERDADGPHAFLGRPAPKCPMLLVVVYDTRKRAPASEADALGMMSLGCVMQNMWLMAETLGIGMQILSTFSQGEAEDELHRFLKIPQFMKIAFACRLGYPETASAGYLRVRRGIGELTHWNRYGRRAPECA
ncbi:Nitroreductase [Burkholderiales bacterium]|jgi:nitroreductase|nr:Nitroreductase [Burkholderiales bacterium]